ncbi:MAG TPA: hypothetical protein VMZ91_03550 [Candidatus Paceibacterota bacterium]|nr:hypothetical protein [Candidatus Paceibacterota bacterium]
MARIKDLKTQNPTYKIDVIDVLSSMDPTKSNKYLPFMIKCTADWVEWINNELKNETFKEMFEVIKDFEDLSQRNLLENKDIYSYESNQDIIEAVKTAKEKITRSEVKKKDTEVLFEDNRWLVVYPLSTRSSNLYGKGTKWCVSSEDNNYGKYYKQYTENGSLVFVIDKTIKESEYRTNDFAKVAFHNDGKKNDGITLWDIKDKQMGVGNAMKVYNMLGNEIMDIINKRLEQGPTNKEVADKKDVRD